MTRQPRLLTLASFAGAAAALAACDAQQPPGYTGEPLTALVGQVVNGRTDAPPAAKVVLVWGDFGAMFPPFGESVNLTGHFPEAFRLELPASFQAQRLYLPSGAFPDGYYDAALESRIALARILAVRQEADSSTYIPSADMLGAAEDQVLVYVEEDVVAGTAGEAYLGGPVPAGYHVFRVKTDAERDAVYGPISSCQNQAADLAAWKACGMYTSLELLPADALVNVRLSDDAGSRDFRWAGPTFLTPGSITDPGPCVPMPGQMPCP